MAWGGKREGAGRKPASTTGKKPNPRKERAPAVPKLNSRATAAPPETIPAEPARPFDARALAMMLPEIQAISEKYARNKKARNPDQNPFRLPKFPKSAIPPGGGMAMDNALVSNTNFAGDQWLNGGDGFAEEGLVFLGYPYLSQLAERTEYRNASETIADDATRKWIDFDVTGDETEQQRQRAKDPTGFDERMADPDQRKKRITDAGKLDKIKALKDDQERLEVQARFYDMSRGDGFFGRMHLYCGIGEGVWDNPAELASSLGNSRDAMSKGKVAIGSFKELKAIEPVWTYPQMYNSNNPLAPDFYNPQRWYVLGREIDASRMMTFIGHPVPDLLKPAYAFGGLSLSQMLKPYVDIWLTTRQSVADLIHSFSVMVLMTDLSTILQPGNAGALMARIALFNMLRDNQGAFVINKATEDFKNVSASLGGLHELQAQAQEHLCSATRIPLVKYTGISPSGLNASSEGEIAVYDDTISAYQNRFMRPNLVKVVNFQQLSLWGEIDPEITITFNPLRALTLAEKGQKQKDDADRDIKYIDAGVLAPEEVRRIIIDDPDLPYAGLDPDDVPEPPAEEGLLGAGAGGAATEFEKNADGDSDQGGGATDAGLPFGSDAAFNESDHPRAANGEFGSGGSAAQSSELHEASPTEKKAARASRLLERLGVGAETDGAATALTSSVDDLESHAEILSSDDDDEDLSAERRDAAAAIGKAEADLVSYTRRLAAGIAQIAGLGKVRLPDVPLGSVPDDLNGADLAALHKAASGIDAAAIDDDIRDARTSLQDAVETGDEDEVSEALDGLASVLQTGMLKSFGALKAMAEIMEKARQRQ